MARIKAIHVREVKRPLRTTFSTSLGQKQHIYNVLVRVVLENGDIGMGEVSTSFAFRRETVPVIKSVLEEASKGLKGADVEDYTGLVHGLRHDFPGASMTVSGLETALFRAFLAGLGTAEHAHWGARQFRLETDVTIPFLTDPWLLNAWVRFAIKKGFTTYKLKVSGRVEEDVLVLSTLRETLRRRTGDFHLRLDGNQGYTVETLMLLLSHIQKGRYEIELFEQPLRKDDLTGLARIRGLCPMPVILDETVLTLDDAQRVIDHDLCDGVNIKLAKSGIGESEKILEYAKLYGMKLMIGCMTETMVGLSAAIFFAAGTAGFAFIDLDSVHFLYGQNRYPGIRREGAEFVIEQSAKTAP